MTYRNTITLKDGRECVLRNGTAADGRAALANFILTHEQTDFLLTYPEETTMTAEEEAQFLAKREASADEIEIVAEVGGNIAGLAGIERVGTQEKLRHRAEFGISIDRAYWGLGIGRALVEASVECARRVGYAQLELAVVAENEQAIALYERTGFSEYGRNPRGFRSRKGYQPLVLMRREL